MAILAALSFPLINSIFIFPFSSAGYARGSDVARVARSWSIQLSGDRPFFITTGYYNTAYIQYTTTMIRHHAPKKHIRKKQLLLLAVTEEQEGGGGSAWHSTAPHDDFIQFHPFPPPFFYPSNVGIGINGVMLGRMSARGGEERDINNDDVMIDEDVDYNKTGRRTRTRKWSTTIVVGAMTMRIRPRNTSARS
jgi:hypothetical protein